MLVSKGDKLRICFDPTYLNNEIKRPYYSMPTLNKAIADMEDAKVFSTFDTKSGYLQVELSGESSHLTTFDTPFGKT